MAMNRGEQMAQRPVAYRFDGQEEQVVDPGRVARALRLWQGALAAPAARKRRRLRRSQADSQPGL